MLTRRILLAGLGAASIGSLGFALQCAAGQVRLPGRAHAVRRFPNHLLTTHEGRRVKFYDDLIKNRLVVINMMYAQCEGICPISTMNLQQVHKALGQRVGRDIFMYSITLEPKHDTPQVLKQYVAARSIQPGWLFLTGEPAHVDEIRRTLGFFDPNPAVDSNRSQHTGMVRIGNDTYDRWHMTPALGEPEPIVEAILHADRGPQRDATASQGT